MVAMDSEETVGREFFEKSAEGANVPETAFGSQANQRVVSYRFQEVDVVRINRDAAELGDIDEDPVRLVITRRARTADGAKFGYACACDFCARQQALLQLRATTDEMVVA